MILPDKLLLDIQLIHAFMPNMIHKPWMVSNGYQLGLIGPARGNLNKKKIIFKGLNFHAVGKSGQLKNNMCSTYSTQSKLKKDIKISRD